jgi:hypothetical protein
VILGGRNAYMPISHEEFVVFSVVHDLEIFRSLNYLEEISLFCAKLADVKVTQCQLGGLFQKQATTRRNLK